MKTQNYDLKFILMTYKSSLNYDIKGQNYDLNFIMDIKKMTSKLKLS